MPSDDNSVGGSSQEAENGIPQPSDVSHGLEEELKAQEPSEERKQELRESHDGHLVRHTTSKLSMDVDMPEGVEVDATAEIPDIYCFTCEEWVGVSGVALRGTPRSRRDAFYLGGMPPAVLTARNGTVKTLIELADALVDRLEHVEERADAFQFIETELQKVNES